MNGYVFNISCFSLLNFFLEVLHACSKLHIHVCAWRRVCGCFDWSSCCFWNIWLFIVIHFCIYMRSRCQQLYLTLYWQCTSVVSRWASVHRGYSQLCLAAVCQLYKITMSYILLRIHILLHWRTKLGPRNARFFFGPIITELIYRDIVSPNIYDPITQPSYST